ncbi:hypothetical protein JCM19233_301 [Vibrio astriarenae]|nr:hypothetical protein JCM19233_301 [Vibrio sp. C7]
MSKTKAFTFGLVSMALLLSTSINAQEETNETDTPQSPEVEHGEAYFLVFPNQYYVSVGANYLLPNDDRSSKDPSKPSMNLLLGMEIAPNWGLEINYLTEAKFDFHNIDLSYRQWELAGRYAHDIGLRWGVYGRFGLAMWELDKHYPSDPHFSDKYTSSGTSFIGEAGASYALSPKLGIDFGYAMVPKMGKGSTGDLTMHRLNLSLTWKFGFKEKAYFISEKG